MPIDWSDSIILANLADEPELSEEFSAIFNRLGGEDTDADEPVEARDAAVAPPGAIPHVVLNFAEVTYLNSSNIAMLLRLRKALADADRTLVLCAMQDPLWSVLMLTGLDKIFTVASDTSTAIAGLQLEPGEGD